MLVIVAALLGNKRDETIAILRLIEIPCLVQANRSDQLR
jgi:hypothetical protein